MMSFLLKRLRESLLQRSAKVAKKTSLGQASLKLLGTWSNYNTASWRPGNHSKSTPGGRPMFFVLFLTKEAYSHGELHTGKLGQTPLSVDQPKEVQIVYRLFLVNCYLLHVPRFPSQPASTEKDDRGWVIEKNWLELAWQYTAVTRNNLYIIWIALVVAFEFENKKKSFYQT